MDSSADNLMGQVKKPKALGGYCVLGSHRSSRSSSRSHLRRSWLISGCGLIALDDYLPGSLLLGPNAENHYLRGLVTSDYHKRGCRTIAHRPGVRSIGLLAPIASGRCES
jgi:hypothetical protein